MNGSPPRRQAETPPSPGGQAFQGFDGMRLVAALAVMFSHAFLMATGTEESEPLVALLHDGHVAGLYGVFVFFIISGFLLARSLSSNPSAITYAVNRVLRIFPAFLFCTLVMAFVVGPLCTSLPLTEYLTSGVYEHVRFSLDSLGDMPLPGVYAYDGPVATVVNGSLWSLRYEALSYVFLLLLWTLFRGKGRVAAVIGTIALLTWTAPAVANAITSIAYTLPYFAAGVCMFWVYSRYGTNRLVALMCAVLLAASVVLQVQAYAFAVFGAYLIVFAAERSNPGSRLAARIGDCSYGLYLYGWPAEQVVRQVTLTTSPWGILAMAVPLAAALALISCHLIERPAMRARGRVAARVRSALAVLLAPHHPAVLGAKLVFVVGAIALFVSDWRWWYFVESMGQLLLAALAGSFAASRLARATRRRAVAKTVATAAVE
jgi:peptidoglycan/LPS O-acetylase OafA/YrhL